MLRPQLLVDASGAIARFDRPVLLVWGEACDFFPLSDAQRLAAAFPEATLVPVPDAKTWVPVDRPDALAGAIAQFVARAGPDGGLTHLPRGGARRGVSDQAHP